MPLKISNFPSANDTQAYNINLYRLLGYYYEDLIE